MGNSASVLAIAIIFVITGLCGLAVLWGTILNKRWGINLDPLSCPRCGTRAPLMRWTRSLGQMLWGGWTCQTCGVGIDRWGREVSAKGPPNVVMSQADLLRVFRRKTILSAPVCFGALMVLDWIGITGSGFPSGWAEALVEVCFNLILTAIYVASFYWGADQLITLLAPTKASSPGPVDERPADRASSSRTAHDKSKTD